MKEKLTANWKTASWKFLVPMALRLLQKAVVYQKGETMLKDFKHCYLFYVCSCVSEDVYVYHMHSGAHGNQHTVLDVLRQKL